MAKKVKKRANKTEAEKIEPIDNALQINLIITEVKKQKLIVSALTTTVEKTNSRIDRLVDAISKAKKVKGI